MDSIQAIALLPRLTSLYLTLPAGVYAGVENGFPSLTKLWLSGSTFDTRIFLAVARPKTLRDLFLHWKSTADQSPLADIAAITHLLSSFPLLRSLDINGEALLSLPTGLDEQQLWSIFEPLLELKRLEHLSYNIPLPLSDQKTARIACAWPRLKELDLYESAGAQSSLESLVHFARHCPDLESLHYLIKARTISPSTIIAPTLSPHRLRVFGTEGETDVMNAPAVALSLYQIFPNITYARGAGDGWRMVQRILNAFIFLRKQDRSFEE
ncbi:hypothetical protein BDP27DRAFT_1351452 [Rhodocollybia butyracea]|uniref:Uncharacterized protein n=1 Tax=Rhodocollybia butyracea TaxID=206335 RepID=A0A9P5P3E3_9AGAR|nr:hypothetical protein BDP27DRAFT_1351452 [Rhodocollybia butyracea]